MNALFGLAILTGIIYSLIVDMTFLKLYLVLVIIYYVITQLLLKEHDPVGFRRTMAIA